MSLHQIKNQLKTWLNYQFTKRVSNSLLLKSLQMNLIDQENYKNARKAIQEVLGYNSYSP
jgi:hypothetical protein